MSLPFDLGLVFIPIPIGAKGPNRPSERQAESLFERSFEAEIKRLEAFWRRES